MGGSKGSVKDNVPMTFVLGTDKNYIVPTLVTIHSLLKNGLKNVNNKVKVNIVALTNQLDESDKKLFCDIFGKITNILQWNKENVGLYFIDIPKDKKNEFWYGDFADVDKKLEFFGANVEGKIMPKYKAFLPFRIKKCGNKFGYNDIGTLLPLSKFNKNAFQKRQFSPQKKLPPFPKKTVSNDNAKTPPILFKDEMKGSLEITHYMWLDSDILINSCVSDLYKKCLGSKSAICCTNYYFVWKDLYHSTEYDKIKIIRDLGHIPYSFELFAKKDGNRHQPSSWRCSGGVMFFNLNDSLFNRYPLRNCFEDEEQFFYWYFTQKNPFGALDEKKDEKKEGKLDEKKEGKLDEKLDEKKEGKLIYAFSPIYNCRPSMPSAAQETSDELKAKQMKVPAELKKITNPEEIAIWHWDGMRKPWQKMYGGFPLIAGKAMSSKYDGLMDADRQWIKEYEEVRLIIKQLKHRFSACLYNFEQMAGKNS